MTWVQNILLTVEPEAEEAVDAQTIRSRHRFENEDTDFIDILSRNGEVLAFRTVLGQAAPWGV